jgi:hypothetical protein
MKGTLHPSIVAPEHVFGFRVHVTNLLLPRPIIRHVVSFCDFPGTIRRAGRLPRGAARSSKNPVNLQIALSQQREALGAAH